MKRRKVLELVYEALTLAEEVLNAPSEAAPSERVKVEPADSVRQLKLDSEAAHAEVGKLKEELAQVQSRNREAEMLSKRPASEQEQKHRDEVEKLKKR